MKPKPLLATGLTVLMFVPALTVRAANDTGMSEPIFSIGPDDGSEIWYGIGESAPPIYLPLAGDTDCNGSTEIADAILLSRFLAEDDVSVKREGLLNADMNSDGFLTMTDLTAILRVLACLPPEDAFSGSENTTTVAETVTTLLPDETTTATGKTTSTSKTTELTEFDPLEITGRGWMLEVDGYQTEYALHEELHYEDMWVYLVRNDEYIPLDYTAADLMDMGLLVAFSDFDSDCPGNYTVRLNYRKGMATGYICVTVIGDKDDLDEYWDGRVWEEV